MGSQQAAAAIIAARAQPVTTSLDGFYPADTAGECADDKADWHSVATHKAVGHEGRQRASTARVVVTSQRDVEPGLQGDPTGRREVGLGSH